MSESLLPVVSSIPPPIPAQKAVVAAVRLPCVLLKARRVRRHSYPARQRER